MKIAIDIDQTLLECDSILYKIFNKFGSKQDKNKKLKYKDVEEEIISEQTLLNCISKIHNHNYYKIMEDASDIIKKWKAEGHEIILLSSRPSYKSLVNTLLLCVKKFDIKFDKITIGCNNKVLFCLEKKVDVLIDNCLDICKLCCEKGVNSIWYNKEEENVWYRKVNNASSWKEIDCKVTEISKNIRKR